MSIVGFDPYAELGVTRDASEADIRSAYRKQAKVHHPDAGGDGDAWASIALAHDVLTDPDRRAEYDRTGRVDASKPDNRRAAALQMVEAQLATILNAFVDGQDPRALDVREVMRRRLSGELTNARSAEPAGVTFITFLRDMQRRFTLRKPDADPDADPIGRSLKRQIEQNEQMLVGLRDTIASIEMAIEIVAEYEFEADQPAFSSFGRRPTFANAGWST